MAKKSNAWKWILGGIGAAVGVGVLIKLMGGKEDDADEPVAGKLGHPYTVRGWTWAPITQQAAQSALAAVPNKSIDLSRLPPALMSRVTQALRPFVGHGLTPDMLLQENLPTIYYPTKGDTKVIVLHFPRSGWGAIYPPAPPKRPASLPQGTVPEDAGSQSVATGGGPAPMVQFSLNPEAAARVKEEQDRARRQLSINPEAAARIKAEQEADAEAAKPPSNIIRLHKRVWLIRTSTSFTKHLKDMHEPFQSMMGDGGKAVEVDEKTFGKLWDEVRRRAAQNTELYGPRALQFDQTWGAFPLIAGKSRKTAERAVQVGVALRSGERLYWDPLGFTGQDGCIFMPHYRQPESGEEIWKSIKDVFASIFDRSYLKSAQKFMDEHYSWCQVRFSTMMRKPGEKNLLETSDNELNPGMTLVTTLYFHGWKNWDDMWGTEAVSTVVDIIGAIGDLLS